MDSYLYHLVIVPTAYSHRCLFLLCAFLQNNHVSLSSRLLELYCIQAATSPFLCLQSTFPALIPLSHT